MVINPRLLSDRYQSVRVSFQQNVSACHTFLMCHKNGSSHRYWEHYSIYIKWAAVCTSTAEYYGRYDPTTTTSTKTSLKSRLASFQTTSRFSQVALLLKRREFRLELRRGGCARVQTAPHWTAHTIGCENNRITMQTITLTLNTKGNIVWDDYWN